MERVVHVSITNPSSDSPLPYFRGKAENERALRESGLSHAILRPAVFFGGGDVLVNNIAWLLRRLPAWVLLAAARLVGLAVGDRVLTRHEVEGLTANLLVSKEPPTGSTRFSDWLAANAPRLGVEWASELQRHYE